MEMELNKIRIDEKRGEQVIVLKEKAGDRLLPIVIGIMEATAIKMKVSNFQPPRPLTHDLLNNVIEELGSTLERVVVAKLEGNVFYAQLWVTRNGDKPLQIDARPSDAIALALRAGSPIWVSEDVLDQIGGTAQ
ncbi:MAG: bifunctional nuclease family protein [Candidatus Omnitrophica bacterium]|nr:bifunctional nuclease family protein [Candidatus Omnitrophota bacterium]